jgi:hypothetical protein
MEQTNWTPQIAQNLLKMLLSYSCEICLDSAIKIERNKISVCDCGAKMTQPALKLFQRTCDRQDADRFVNINIVQAARCLVRATPQTPISLTALCQHLSASDRTVKSFIESARNEWHLPIGANRNFPSGYYWIETPEQMKAWIREFSAQPLKELQTLHGVVKANFPELAGQINLDFEEVENDGTR